MAVTNLLSDISTEETQKQVLDQFPGFFKRMMAVFGKMSFSANSSLRVDCGGSTVAVGTVTKVTTMSTGNIGFGDSGKPSTVQQMSANTFYGSIGRNFTRG
jgi:hypothetical protein